MLGLWKLKETTWEFASESRLLLQQLETQRARALLEQKWSAHCPIPISKALDERQLSWSVAADPQAKWGAAGIWNECWPNVWGRLRPSVSEEEHVFHIEPRSAWLATSHASAPAASPAAYGRRRSTHHCAAVCGMMQMDLYFSL